MKHYLSYIEDVMKKGWDKPAITNYGANTFRNCDIAANIDEWVDWQSDTMRDGDYVRKSLNKLLKEIDNARKHTKK